MATQHPLFIVGCVRSGTTLLRLMLTHHPEIEIFGEFEESVSQLGDRGWPDLDAYYAFLRTDRAFQGHDFKIDKSLDYPDLVRDFFAQAAARTQKPIVGASIHSRFDRCPDLWRDARYIHVVRDPRDVAASCVRMGWHGNVFHAVRMWMDAEKRWERLCELTRPEQRHEIKYESLIRDPEGRLKEVCDFVGVPFSPAMLEYERDTTYSRPDASLAQRWRHELKPREIRHIESRCFTWLADRGYEPSGLEALDVGPTKQACLYLDHRIRRAQASIRALGLGQWVFERAAKATHSPRLQRTAMRRHNAINLRRLK